MIDFRQSKYWMRVCEWVFAAKIIIFNNIDKLHGAFFSFVARVQCVRIIWTILFFLPPCRMRKHWTSSTYSPCLAIELVMKESLRKENKRSEQVEWKSHFWPYAAAVLQKWFEGSSCYARQLNLSRCQFSALHYVNPSCTFMISCEVSRALGLRYFSWSSLRGATMLRFDAFMRILWWTRVIVI